MNIQAQLDWEEAMISRGVTRFRDQQAKAEVNRAHETSAGSRLMRSYVIAISDQIDLYLKGQHPDGRRRNKYAKLLATLDTDKVAMFALRQVISAVFSPGGSIARLCTDLGRACEDELRFMHFEAEYKAYYDTLIRDFERKHTTSYKHKRRVLAAKGADQGLVWHDWDEETLFGVGSLVVSLLMEVCDLVEKQNVPKGRGRVDVILVPTQDCVEWITKHNELTELTNPDRMPCLIPPMDWTSVTDGGYYSPSLRRRTKLIKTPTADRDRERFISEASMDKVFTAVNAMQRTAWTVNSRVHDVMQEVWQKNLECGMPRSEPYEFPECPLGDIQAADIPAGHELLDHFSEWKAVTRELHVMEKERVAKNLALVRTMRLARDMNQHDEFYYVYQADFRGRLYCTASGLNPQGTDQSKALIMFANPKRLGDTGLRWFLINGANKYGYDKVSYDERVAWVHEKAPEFFAVAADPISNRAIWAEADKPWQFLAWCFEFSDAMNMDDYRDFESHLPVGLDGSCNGLQHFSAMLGDSVGGTAVNLLPSDKPEDIYQAVADVAYGKLQAKAAEGEGAAINWINVLGESMPRSLTKAPVMTLPYGSTQQACTSSIYSWVHKYYNDSFEKNTAFRHSLYLSPIIWESIGEVVIAARAAMDWLQDCAGILARYEHGLKYTSPIGFPVLQQTMKYSSRQIRTQIGGDLRVRLASPTDELNGRKQRQGSSPNFVHHIDATHLMMTVIAALAEGIVDFAMIHDDFGTHAADADALQECIRRTFVELHTDNDVLAEFKRVHEESSGIELPPLPERGDLDINAVLQSPYFFG